MYILNILSAAKKSVKITQAIFFLKIITDELDLLKKTFTNQGNIERKKVCCCLQLN